MKKITVAITLILLLVGCNNSRSDQDDKNYIQEKKVYDSVLARELGADSYGMKHAR